MIAVVTFRLQMLLMTEFSSKRYNSINDSVNRYDVVL